MSTIISLAALDRNFMDQNISHKNLIRLQEVAKFEIMRSTVVDDI